MNEPSLDIFRYEFIWVRVLHINKPVISAGISGWPNSDSGSTHEVVLEKSLRNSLEGLYYGTF